MEPEKRLENILNEHEIVVFTRKGVEEEENKEMLELLQKIGILVNCFDIRVNNQFKRMMEEKHKIFPCLYIKNQLQIDSCEVLSNLHYKEGQLLSKIPKKYWRLSGAEKVTALTQQFKLLVFIYQNDEKSQ